MRYEVFSQPAEKSLDGLDAAMRKRIVEKLRLLSGNPFALPYKKIKNRDKTYSVRVGDYKVIFILSEGMKFVF